MLGITFLGLDLFKKLGGGFETLRPFLFYVCRFRLAPVQPLRFATVAASAGADLLDDLGNRLDLTAPAVQPQDFHLLRGHSAFSSSPRMTSDILIHSDQSGVYRSRMQS